MSIFIPMSGENAIAALRREELERIAFEQRSYIDRKTVQSERGENMPETIESTDLLDTSMNWDYSPGWEARRVKHVKALRAKGIPFRPSVRVRMPGGGIQNVYEGDLTDLAWFEQGLCCVRCCNWKSEDAAIHVQDHERLQRVTGAAPPSGIPVEDLCGHCGARLDTQKFRAEAA